MENKTAETNDIAQTIRSIYAPTLLAGKVALVTGASRGIGRAIAKGLLLAAEMTRSEGDPPSTKIYFVSTRDRAWELLLQLRARQEEHRV